MSGVKPSRRRRLRWAAAGIAASALLLLGWVARPMLLPPAGEPLAEATDHAVPVIQGRAGRASVLFVGDTHFGESYSAGSGRNASEQQVYVRPLARLQELLRSADLVIANLETPLTRRKFAPLGYLKRYVHWGDPELSAHALRRAGIEAVSLANNHAYDALGPGLVDTRAALRSRGIASFGAGSTLAEAARAYRCELRFGRRRLRLAVIGTFERQWDDLFYGVYATSSAGGTYPLAARTISGQIRALKREDADLFVVAFPHWGRNYAWRSPGQAALAEVMLEAGADLVVGHGAHLFQQVELREGRVVLYGLGNFVFLSPGRYASRKKHPWSLAARLDFTQRDGAAFVEMALYFLASDNRQTHYQPRVLEGDEFDRAAALLLEQSPIDPEARSQLRDIARIDRDRAGAHVRLTLGRVRQ
jgi:poly-gamma-glutamate capsule biosynthesis protein CapA/YwtB (metallophosphatase superfamily)